MHLLKTLMIRALVILPLCGYGLQAQAALVFFDTELSSSNEVPGVVVPSVGTGSGIFVLDTDTNFFGWGVGYANLTGPAIAAHIHGQLPLTIPGTANGGVEINLGMGPGVMISTIGSAMGGFIGGLEITDAQRTSLLQGLWYVNIHTVANTPGEIRGQISRIPEPATLGLLGLGIAGLIGLRRKQRTAH